MTRQYTQQEVLDKVWNHFVVERNELSLFREQGRYEGCYEMYPGGPRCAIGIFLDDAALADLRTTNKLSASVVQLFDELDLVQFGFAGVGLEFLEEIQRAHDYATDIDTCPTENRIETTLRHVADLYNLKVPQ